MNLPFNRAFCYLPAAIPAMRAACRTAALLMFAMLFVAGAGDATAARQSVTIYADELASGWMDYSWKSIRKPATSPTRSGTNSLAVTLTGAWGALYLHTDEPASTAGFENFRFWVHGGSTGGQRLQVVANEDTGKTFEFTAQANIWSEVIVPLATLGNPASLSDLYFQDTTGKAQPTFYLDDIALVRLPTASYSIFGERLASDWADYSWKSIRNPATKSPVHGGTNSLGVTLTGAWGALYLHANEPVNTYGYDLLRFWVHGGTAGGQRLQVAANEDTSRTFEFTAQANTWTEVLVPLSALGSPASLSDLYWQDMTGKAQPIFYLDDIALVHVPTAPYYVYADALTTGWADYSWKSIRKPATTSPTHGGPYSLAVTLTGAWGALYLHTDEPVDTHGFDRLRFWVHGGSTGGQRLQVAANEDTGKTFEFTAQANTWNEVIVPLKALGNPAAISDLYWQDQTGAPQPTFYLDDIALLLDPVKLTADCLFNWAERFYPRHFSPPGAISTVFGPYHFRYYAGTGNHLAISTNDDHVWVLGPLSGNRLLDAGAVGNYLAPAGCSR